MDENQIFEKYVKSWLEQDQVAFSACLSEKVEVHESYGPFYCGKRACQRWFNHWFTIPENKMLAWDITGKYYDHTKQCAFFTWHFACFYKGKQQVFDGISTVTYDHQGKILVMKEYQSTLPHNQLFSKI